jgi:hypothetical protein
MPTDQDDADALFGGAAASKPPPFASKPMAEHRKESRVRVNWQARVLLPGDRIVQLNVFDLSESGIGLVTEVGIPAHTVLPLALAVPGLHDPGRITAISGTIKTNYMTVRGQLIHCGGTWVQIPSESCDLLNQWVRRLRQ